MNAAESRAKLIELQAVTPQAAPHVTPQDFRLLHPTIPDKLRSPKQKY